MAEDGQLARIAGRPAPAESLADLLDPIALEERLREARARRAQTLSRNPEGGTPTPLSPPSPGDPHSTHPSAPRAAAAFPVLIFLAGLGLGGAAVAVLALLAVLTRITALPPAPESAALAAASVVAPQAPMMTAPTVATTPPDAPAIPAADHAAPETAPLAESYALGGPSELAEPGPDAVPPHRSALPVLAATLSPAPRTEAPAAAPPANAPPANARALPARVFVHYPSSASETAARARAALLDAGIEAVEIVPVRYAIGRINIRFYHEGDRQPAAALAALVSGALAGEAPEARDFTDYANPAAPGTVEVWLAGTPTGPAATTPMRNARSTPRRAKTPFQMPGVIAPPQSQAERVEKILIERLRQQGR